RVATQIAVGALRYFLLRYTRTTVIAFDFQEALSFEGETGPYVQYAAVRARNILRKAESAGGPLPHLQLEPRPHVLGRLLKLEDLWQMMLTTSKTDAVLKSAVDLGEPAHVAKYAFQLAQSFNNFYHRCNVLHEEEREKRTFLLWLTSFFFSRL